MSFRRTWDKEYYEAKAQGKLIETAESSEANKDGNITAAVREEFKPAAIDAQGPEGSQRAFLKAREAKVDLESKAGKTELYTPNVAEIQRGLSGPGFRCEACDCVLKVPPSYLTLILVYS
jgi:U4/U6.U5 tri-snRNP component SNU23